MAETFSAIITILGLAEITEALADGTTITLNNYSVGDSNGSYYTPTVGQTTLVNSVYGPAVITSLSQDLANTNRVIARATVPAGVGDWWIRELGIWSSSGDLFAIAKVPETFKSLEVNGATKELIFEIVLEISNSSVLTMIIDPNLALDTKDYIDGFIKYVQYKFNDCVVCDEVSNPLGDSGVVTNPYGVALSNLKPNTGTERIFVYATEHKEDGRLLTNDSRVFTQGNIDNFGRPDVLGSISEQIGLSAPKSVLNKNTLYLESNTVLYCTFKGTGLILRWSPAILVTTDIEYSLDEGTWTTISYDNTGMTSLDRTDTLGIVDVLTSSQTYGEHTIRVRIKSTSNYSNIRIIGFDIISDYDSIPVSPGEYFINATLYENEVGDNLVPQTIGTNNHRRDRISVDDDSAIHLTTGIAVSTPTYYLDSGFTAERAKEELKNIYNVSDFFQAESFARTLGDGVTNFQADQLTTIDSTTGIDIDGSNTPWVDTYALGSDVNFKFTFVGTGCDVILRLEDIGGSTTGVVMNIYVDEVLKGTLTESDFQSVESASGDSYLSYPVCTGLPYGSHTVRLEAKNAGATDNWSLYVKAFAVYQAKTPDLLDDHIDLGCTNLTPSDGWITYSPEYVKYLGSQWNKITSVSQSQDISSRYFGYDISSLPGFDNEWESVAYGNNIWVAVASTGSSNRVMTSPDGVNWTKRITNDNNWQDVVYGAGLFVVVSSSGTGDRVMTSPDGITWTIRTSAADNQWLSLVYGNGLFVATAITGTLNRVMTSPDGITWTIRTTPVDNQWYAVTYGNSLFVATSSDGSGDRVMTSPDGITWTIRTSAADNNWQGITYGAGLFVAVAASGTGDRVMTSPDGITWTIRTSAADNNWFAVTYDNSIFVAVAASGTDDRVMTSPDGITWTIRTSAADNHWNSVTYSNSLFITVSETGDGNRVMTSPDGINWTARNSYTIIGDTAEFTFTGTSVIWLGESGNDDGMIAIYLDGTLLTTSHPDWSSLTVTTEMPSGFDDSTGIVDCYETGDTLVSEREGIKITGLTAGLHTIKLEGVAKNASSNDYNIPVHGFQVMPLPYILDSEQNWEDSFNSVSRNCSAVKRDSKIKELEQGKQDQSDVLDTVIAESIIESSEWEDSLLDPSTPFTANTTRVFTVPFRTKKIATPVVIIVNSGSEEIVASNITTTEFIASNAADQSTEFPDIIIAYTAIAQ